MPSRNGATTLGLLERIKAAVDEAELVRLMQEGMGYQKASDGTRARWRRAAVRRREELAP